jgi:hypothetical protein
MISVYKWIPESTYESSPKCQCHSQYGTVYTVFKKILKNHQTSPQTIPKRFQDKFEKNILPK